MGCQSNSQRHLNQPLEVKHFLGTLLLPGNQIRFLKVKVFPEFPTNSPLNVTLIGQLEAL